MSRVFIKLPVVYYSESAYVVPKTESQEIDEDVLDEFPEYKTDEFWHDMGIPKPKGLESSDDMFDREIDKKVFENEEAYTKHTHCVDEVFEVTNIKGFIRHRFVKNYSIVCFYSPVNGMTGSPIKLPLRQAEEVLGLLGYKVISVLKKNDVGN